MDLAKGEKGSEVKLSKPRKVKVAAKVAASAGNFTAAKGADQLMDAKLKAQFAKSFPEAALKNVKWYPAVPPGIEDIEGKVLDRVKAAS